MISRRQFLIASAATMAIPPIAFSQPTPTIIQAESMKTQLMPDGPITSMWGYNGSTPGPTIRARQGSRVSVNFKNAIPQNSAIHWHGIHLDNAMDGVPELTQKAVSQGSNFLYDFAVPDAGTYWYHSHSRSWEQVARGLYGALIVGEPTAIDVDHDIVVFIDDWRLDRSGSLDDNFDSRHDHSHGGRLGNFAQALFKNMSGRLYVGERVRLRLINTATDRIFPLVIDGIQGKIVAYDGMPLAQPEQVDQLVLGPGQRIDIIADLTGNDLRCSMVTRDGLLQLGNVPVAKQKNLAQRGAIVALPTNRLETPAMDQAVKLNLVMEGGAMSRRVSGMVSGQFWTFNGRPTSDQKPLHSFQTGQTGIITLINDTRFPHTIHIHGHHFQEITDNTLDVARDTALLDAGETRHIACVFNNPGKWLLHCHMLSHQASGMKTWIEVKV